MYFGTGSSSEGLSPSVNPKNLAASFCETNLSVGCDSTSGELPGSRNLGSIQLFGGDLTCICVGELYRCAAFSHDQPCHVPWPLPPGISNGMLGLPECGFPVRNTSFLCHGVPGAAMWMSGARQQAQQL